MTAHHPLQIARSRLLPLIAAGLVLGLAACGGGGDDDSATLVAQDTAQSMSADSAVLPSDSSDAMAEVVNNAKLAVTSAQASQTYACPGGGTAVFTATGGSAGSLVNGAFDAGEVYSVTYNGCRGASGAASVDGTATLTVVSASATSTVLTTQTQGVVVTLPNRTLTLNGSSTFSQEVADNGNGSTTTTRRWTSPQIVVTSLRAARQSSFTLSSVDVTRMLTTTGGVVTARSTSGGFTLAASLPNGSWTITVASQGGVSFDAAGVPTQGAWTITLPHNRLDISVVPGTLTIAVDHGPDGSIDRTYVFSPATVASGAD